MSADDSTRLSEREQEILVHVARSATNQQIAQDLGISIHTVKVHMRNIFGKIGVSSRTEAAVYALQQGLVQLNEVQIEDAPHETTQADNPVISSPDTEAIPAPATAHETAEQEDTDSAVVPSEGARTAASTTPAPARTPAHSMLRRPTVIGGILLGILLVFGVIYYTYISASPTASTAADNESSSAPSSTATQLAPSHQTLATMLQPLQHFAVAVYGLDERIYVIGGTDGSEVSSTIARYDPQIDLWVELSDKPTPVSHIRAETVRGKVYVPGGEGLDNTVLETFEAFDPRTQQWETLPDLPAPRSRYALASTEGRLYLFGGWDGTSYRDETFIYDLSLGEWMEGPALPTPRRNAGAAVIEGQIFVVGGEDASGALRATEHYDPTRESLGAWAPAAPMPVAIADPAAVSFLDNLLVFHPEPDELFSYTPRNDAWMKRPFPPDIDVSSRAAVLDARLYLFGEALADTPGTLTVYEADFEVYRTFIPSVSRP